MLKHMLGAHENLNFLKFRMADSRYSLL